MGLDTVDVDDLFSQFSEDLLKLETAAAVSSAVAALPWLAAPNPFSKIALEIIEKSARELLEYLNKQFGWILFRFNTTVFTTDQGKDYIATIEKRLALPDDVSDEIWDAAEEEANHALKNLVNLRR